MYGEEVAATRCVGRRGQEVLHIVSDPGKPREIPAWMTDISVCSTVAVGSAQASVDALLALRQLLDRRSSPRSPSEASVATEQPDEADTETDGTSVQLGAGSTTAARGTRRPCRSGNRA